MAEVTCTKYLVDKLTLDLAAHGLETDVDGIRVTAINPAAENVAQSPRGRLLNPGLRQTVVVRPHPDHLGTFWWWWEWPGPTRDSSPDYELLCPGRQTDEAASRIAKVLAMPNFLARTDA